MLLHISVRKVLFFLPSDVWFFLYPTAHDVLVVLASRFSNIPSFSLQFRCTCISIKFLSLKYILPIINRIPNYGGRTRSYYLVYFDLSFCCSNATHTRSCYLWVWSYSMLWPRRNFMTTDWQMLIAWNVWLRNTDLISGKLSSNSRTCVLFTQVSIIFKRTSKTDK